MRISGSRGDYLELEVASFGPGSPPPSSDEDLLLIVVVHYGGLAGKIGTWVGHRDWSSFLGAAEEIERPRTGAAHLESLSPGELISRHESRTGPETWVLREPVGTRSQSHEASLRFGLLSSDPSSLPAVVRELKGLASDRQLEEADREGMAS